MTDPNTAAAPSRCSIPATRRIAATALLVSGSAALLALGGAKVLTPPGYFTKYTEAAQASEELRRVRASDYSPLYLAMARGVVPRWNATGLLVVNVAAHSFTCAAVAAVVALAAGWGWGLGAGLVAAAYRPFLIYTAVLEPEMVLVALLAAALLAGVLARGQVGDSHGPGGFAGVAGIALGLAALARPAYLVLVPAWALWVAWHDRRRWRWRAALLVVAGAAVVITPVLVHRWLNLGSLVLMDPGPVFYEGNGPQALGAPGADPELVKRIETLRAEGSDWGHVAYRELAVAGGASSGNSAESNRFWAKLALEYTRAEPARAARRFLAKAVYALGPYEFHDLPEAEELDRRLRRALPWGFSMLVVMFIASLPGLPRAAPALAGAAALGLLSLAVQVAFYASARQRLPLALAVLLIAPLALSRLRGVPRRRVLVATLGGLAVAAGLAWHTAPLASFRHAQLSTVLGPAPPAPLAAWLDGRAWRAGTALAAERVVLAEQPRWQGETGSLEAYLLPALASEVPWLRGRAHLQLARHHAARGARREAADLACRAADEAPQMLRAQALCAAGKGASHGDFAAHWRPPGVDRTSARFAFARALVAVGDRDTGTRVAAPVLEAFPELAVDLVAP